MTDYKELDNAIITEISNGMNLFYRIDRDIVHDLSFEIAQKTKREHFRVIDGRLQSLRKRGLITYHKFHGWRVTNK